MEEVGRAGIATFVMRGKEYLVAILAEDGILRAETLRFDDELRSPEAIGLPQQAGADPKAVQRMRQCIGKRRVRALDRDWLVDSGAERLLAYLLGKLKRGKDVVAAPQAGEESANESAEIIDLMQVLKQRLKGGTKAE